MSDSILFACFNIAIFFLYRAELEKHGYKMETS